MSVEFKVGPEVIASYKRLSYTPWHALAEFVDNSTQSFFDHRESLEERYRAEASGLFVSIAYDREEDVIRVADNSSGMPLDVLRRALRVGHPPPNPHGRSRYGLGMKTAACWLGDVWTIRTKPLGGTEEYSVTIDVPAVAGGATEVPITETSGMSPTQHHTVLEIRALHRKLHGRTIAKVRDYLRSMYREDFRRGDLRLSWRNEELAWEEMDEDLLRASDGTTFKKDFEFTVHNRSVRGWVGVLGPGKGGRARAGFSMLHSGRVIRGWPGSWRPQSLFGQEEGTNNLINQRLVGEVWLDDFEVSHTKDDILWVGDEEEIIEEKLFEHCADYRDVANRAHKHRDERGPTPLETKVAVDELEKELQSPEAEDVLELEVMPPPDVIRRSFANIVEAERNGEPSFRVELAGMTVKVFLVDHQSENDPYYVSDATRRDEVPVVVNQRHPHWTQLAGSEGVLNYLRHCVYDAIAEHQARHRIATGLDPDTIKLFKDRLLRLPFSMERAAAGRQNGGG